MANFILDHALLIATIAVMLALLLVARAHHRSRTRRVVTPPVGAYRTYPTYR